MPLYNFPPYIVDVIVDFGFHNGRQIIVPEMTPFNGQEETTASVTVTAPWIRQQSIITCSPMGVTTVDHDPEDVVIEGIIAYGINIVPGVSFDVMAYAPQNTWGKYLIRVSVAGYISMQG